jgi:hypothetical protein
MFQIYIELKYDGFRWIAQAVKNEYIDGKPRLLTLCGYGNTGQEAVDALLKTSRVIPKDIVEHDHQRRIEEARW